MKMPASIGQWIVFVVLVSAATVVATNYFKVGHAREEGRAIAVAAQCMILEATQFVPCTAPRHENFRRIGAEYVVRGSVPHDECVAFLDGFDQPSASVYASSVKVNGTAVKDGMGIVDRGACSGLEGSKVYEIRLPVEVGARALALEQLHQSSRAN